MKSAYVTLFCVLLVTELALSQAAATCTSKEFQMTAEPTCDVYTAVKVDFDVKSITPNQKLPCDETETVCIKFPTTVTFTGKFVDGTVLTISGIFKTAQLPVVVTQDRRLATPTVGRFPNAEALPFASALTFDLPLIVDADAIYSGCSKATAGREANCATTALCCLITSSELKMWGRPGSQKFVSFAKANSYTIYIPIVTQAANDVDPTPLMLETPTAVLGSPVTVTVPFIATGVKQGTEELTPAGTGACADKCYTIDKTPLMAIFSGKVPTEPVTYTISDGQKKVVYTFGNAGAVMKSDLVTFVTTAVGVTFVLSRI